MNKQNPLKNEDFGMNAELMAAEIIKLREENRKLKCQLADISAKMKNEMPQPLLGEVFQPSWSWINKIIYVLYKAAKPIQSKEIVDMLLLVDEEFKTVRDRTKLLSVHLHNAVKYGRVRSFKVRGERGAFYFV